MEPCPFATLHLARFDELTTLPPASTSMQPDGPVVWMVGADELASGAGGGAGGQRAFAWVGLGLHRSEASARALLEAGDAAVPCFDGAAERWSAVLQPFNHRGEVNWLDREAPGPVFAPSGDGRTDDPFVAVTSVGWILDEHFDLARVLDFGRGSARVVATLSGVDGLHSGQVFTFPQFEHDTLTVTFWRDAAAMRSFAYRPGEHKDQMDRFRRLQTADRTSFTRLRVLGSRGTWMGSDPLAW